MNISRPSKILPGLILALAIMFVGANYFGALRAQDNSQLPARAGYVNDFAAVVDDNTKQRLEAMLANLKLRSGIEFGVATIQTTGTKDIFDVSRELSVNWNLGARNSRQKSLLLVIAVNEKTAFTQFSRAVQTDLPDGVLGEVGQIMRGSIGAGNFSQALNDGVAHFIAVLSRKIGFAVQDIDQTQVASVSETVEPVSVPSSSPTDSAASPALESRPTETATVVKASSESAAGATRPRVIKPKEKPTPVKAVASTYVNTPEDDADEAEEVELVLTLPLAERVAKLKGFLEEYSNSKSKPRAIELLISTYAALGDQNLKNGDRKTGTEQLFLAISEAPVDIGEKLFAGVIAQIPSNLYLRGEQEAAFTAARSVEEKFGNDAKRLLILSAFYLGIESGDEAARLASRAVKLEPELAEAHRVLGLGLHLALRLDEAAAEYKRALELEPNSKQPTRRSLADLNRAAGKAETALALYREQLAAEPGDRAARAGVVLSLLDLGRTAEGRQELDAALAKDPQDLILLAGAAYWFAAHDDTKLALELAEKAVLIEPRYTWSQIAIARALVGQKRPLEAERAVRFASLYGKFPTLDYELASVLASLGLYDEAADTLQRSFTYKDGHVETRLAGRVPARAESFTERLAPERRASIFQSTSAERRGEAATLKSLLAFTAATPFGTDVIVNESQARKAAKEFASGSDNMLAYRQLYAANRLLNRRVALDTAFELTAAARSSIEVALEVPAATVAVQAEELRELRARALMQGGTPNVPEAPRSVLANLMRGRLEDLAGLALFNQDKTTTAIEHFRRALAILPEDTPAWRNALWHLGRALDQAGEKQEALNFYIRSYKAGDPDPLRRSVIEQAYQKANGSLTGLEERLSGNAAATNFTPAVVEKPLGNEAGAVSAPTESPVPSQPEPAPTMVARNETPVATSPPPSATPSPETTPAPTPTPEASPSPETTPSPELTRSQPEPTTPTNPDPLAPPKDVESLAKIPTTVKVTGKIKKENGEAITNVVVVLISPRGTVLSATTDVDGNYTFVVPPSVQTYRVIPSKDGFTFAPVDKMLTGFTEDQLAVDFVGKVVRLKS